MGGHVRCRGGLFVWIYLPVVGSDGPPVVSEQSATNTQTHKTLTPRRTCWMVTPRRAGQRWHIVACKPLSTHTNDCTYSSTRSLHHSSCMLCIQCCTGESPFTRAHVSFQETVALTCTTSAPLRTACSEFAAAKPWSLWQWIPRRTFGYAAFTSRMMSSICP